MEVSQADPLRLRPHGLSFDELKNLTEYLDRLLDDADASLAYYRDPVGGGFDHLVIRPRGRSRLRRPVRRRVSDTSGLLGNLTGRTGTTVLR